MGRILEPKLRSWYHFRLDTDPMVLNEFEEAKEIRNPNKVLVAVSKVSDDFREATGKNDGLRVELAQMTSDGRASKEPWCMSEVMSKVAFAEVETGVKSGILTTEHCMTLFRDAVKNKYAITNSGEFRPGDIIIWNHSGTDQGHTGVFIKWTSDKQMLVAEGNTTSGIDSDGKIVREGGGGYIVKRKVGTIGSMLLKGAARPFPAYKV